MCVIPIIDGLYESSPIAIFRPFRGRFVIYRFPSRSDTFTTASKLAIVLIQSNDVHESSKLSALHDTSERERGALSM